jgi:hypothetical protein
MTGLKDLPIPDASSLPADSPFTRTRLAMIIGLVLAMLAIVSAIQFQAPQSLGITKTLTDYDAFHIAGLLARDGRAEDAYRLSTMFEAQQAYSGTNSFMPWTYPPPFTMVVAGLASLPVGIGFLLFIVASFALYLHVLRRMAGPALPGVLIVMLPTLLLLARTGQNGFLTGGLTGLFLLALFRSRQGGGVPLGLMVIKPHLAVGISLITLAERRWQTMLIAAATVLAALALSTWALGPGVWQGFADGVGESGNFLRRGLYLLFRMTSIYAFAHTLGLHPGLALALHGLGAACAIAAMLWLWKTGAAPHRLAASICCASLFISPYNYDYDLTLFGLAVALVLPDLLQRTSAMEQAGLVLLSWLATGYGLMRSVAMGDQPAMRLDDPRLGTDALSLMAPLLLLLILLAVRILGRAPRPVPQPEPARPVLPA